MPAPMHALLTYLSSLRSIPGSPRPRDVPVHRRVLNLVSGLDSDEELGLLCHHASYLGD